jgi:DNA polymerase-3 subunit gamma/tau
MSYTVLARKFRSQTFEEVIGQDTTTTTLRNAISQGRVHHGYLFCGTRGVGKTSVARILAKALNCSSADGPTVTPCGSCDACQAIARGDDLDVVEIDAASNTSVDNIRELRSNAIYRPTRSRFKIYIIDEVHMLSTAAFNALLKTLEEPPDHVKFIFATTEPQKVPATILSRVQRFDFKSIPSSAIADQLTRICREEEVEAEEAALKRLARLANGSMRDALSLLDQVLCMAGRQITAEIVNELFPAVHDEQFAALIDRLAESDAAGALEIVDQSLGQGQTLDYWCTLLIGQIRDLMILRVCGEATDLVDVPAGLRPRLAEQAGQFDAGAFVYMISVLEELRRSVKFSGSGRALVEAAIVRLAEAVNFSSLESLLEQVGQTRAPESAAERSGARSVVKKAPSRPKEPVATRGPGRGTRSPAAAAASKAPPAGGPIAAAKPRPDGNLEKSPSAQTGKGPLPAEALSIGRRMTQADLKAAHAEPAVKTALEVFGGQVVHVHRAPASESASGPPTEPPLTEAQPVDE